MDPLKALYSLSSYSVRRFYVDSFLLRILNKAPAGSRIIDLGGVKYQRRGVVDIITFEKDKNFTYECANLSSEKKPEILCDIVSIPRDSNLYDIVVLTEVLEHLPQPEIVLMEAHRLLKPEGRLYICTPYFFHVHPDPKDYARYSPDWYYEKLDSCNFKEIVVQPQGTVFMTALNLLKMSLYEMETSGKIKNRFVKLLKDSLLKLFIKSMLYLDNKYSNAKSVLIRYSTTGFAVECIKKDSV